MATVYIRQREGDALTEVLETNPLPVRQVEGAPLRAPEDSTLLHKGVASLAAGPPFDARALPAVVAHLVVSATATVTWQGSLDGANWVSILARNIATAAFATTATASGVFVLPGGMFVRANITSYTSGVVTVLVRLSDAPPTQTAAAGAPVVADTELPAASALADAAATPTAPAVGAHLMTYNGATWDLLRSGAVANVAAATGFLDALLVGIYNATAPTITDTRYNALQLDINGNLKTVVGKGYSFLNIAAGQATTAVKASAGYLHSIILNSAATATNTTVIYDHPSGAGTVIGRPAVTTATVPTTLLYDLDFANGLTIITAVANGGDMTVVYR